MERLSYVHADADFPVFTGLPAPLWEGPVETAGVDEGVRGRV